MPSIAAHMVIAKLVSEILDINNKDFIKGNILPDVILDIDSHHKIEGENFLVPDLDYFKNNLDFTKTINLGYYAHLLLDKYFLEEYVPNKIGNLKVFENKAIYKDYDLANKQLLDNFDVDVKYYTKVLEELYDYPNINSPKLSKNITCLNYTYIDDTKYLNTEDFSYFLDEISYVISKEVSKYASKPKCMSLCIRK